MDFRSSTTRSKAFAWVITASSVALFALPGLRHALPAKYAARDSFPVSTFEMFTTKRPEEHRMTWVRALDVEGETLGHVASHVFNASGMNQTMAHLKEARHASAVRRAQMCEKIARRVATRERMTRVARIQIVDAYYRPEKVFGPERDDRPERERVLVGCPVARRDP